MRIDGRPATRDPRPWERWRHWRIRVSASTRLTAGPAGPRPPCGRAGISMAGPGTRGPPAAETAGGGMGRGGCVGYCACVTAAGNRSRRPFGPSPSADPCGKSPGKPVARAPPCGRAGQSMPCEWRRKGAPGFTHRTGVKLLSTTDSRRWRVRTRALRLGVQARPAPTRRHPPPSPAPRRAILRTSGRYAGDQMTRRPETAAGHWEPGPHPSRSRAMACARAAGNPSPAPHTDFRVPAAAARGRTRLGPGPRWTRLGAGHPRLCIGGRRMIGFIRWPRSRARHADFRVPGPGP
jgi:hypothetical protein